MISPHLASKPHCQRWLESTVLLAIGDDVPPTVGPAFSVSPNSKILQTMAASLLLSHPLTLPCGLVFPNRLAKAAMTEQMADSEKLPTPGYFKNAYGAWADGGWGMLLTGNVQIDAKYLGGLADLALDSDLPRDKLLSAYKDLAQTCKRNGTPTIVQINHPGRQSPLGHGKRSIFAKSIAPSPVPLNLGSGLTDTLAAKIAFGTPREMTLEDIDHVVQRFVDAARLCVDAGFDGVQIHAAHGYLLTQFLSSRSNRRTDAYGGSAAARAKIVVDIAKAIRAAVPANFCVGLKLNSADHHDKHNEDSQSELEDCLEQAALIAAQGLDFVEISGGSYEDPLMMNGGRETVVEVSKSTAARESFFLDFAREMRKKLPNTILMVTGGFRSRAGMEAALEEGACDIVGIARPAVINPALPKNIIFNPALSGDEARVDAKRIHAPWIVKKLGPRSIGAGYESVSPKG
ncbi:hypothetical protein jhhlp_005015 [Lomentospora prolificans]|uniref:NADH:flavin oxidoreductase/NADH oxidase N-terminal domain-containing protein n=1 Tax=Lomentospora prolificans TaxID=41688 RepID=A0A2N3N872_9PEZI|nr:hypothetical protein jhhlp_005015 [Lomentospora prolificans]